MGRLIALFRPYWLVSKDENNTCSSQIWNKDSPDSNKKGGLSLRKGKTYRTFGLESQCQYLIPVRLSRFQSQVLEVGCRQKIKPKRNQRGKIFTEI